MTRGSSVKILLMRTGGVTKIILCADHFYNKIIACFCAILRIYAPSLEGSKDAFRHELIVFQTSKLAEKAPIQRASCPGSRLDSDYERSSQFEIWLVLRLNGAKLLQYYIYSKRRASRAARAYEKQPFSEDARTSGGILQTFVW